MRADCSSGCTLLIRPIAHSASGVSRPPWMVISGLVIGALVASSLGWQAVANSASVAMKMILRILFLGVNSKGVWIWVLLICLVTVFAYALPDSRINLREEGVGVLPTVMNMRDIELVHQW